MNNDENYEDLSGHMVIQTVDFKKTSGLAPISDATTGTALTQAIWGINNDTMNQIQNISRVYASKHGMFASVPIVCRDMDCAYKDVCMVDPAQRTYGARCPMEIAAILSRYEQWCHYFDIDVSKDQIDSKDIVDATLVKDLVNIEVQMMRVENRIALSGDFMADVLLDIDKKCKAYYGKDISPEAKFQLDLEDKKIKLLNQLNATRKDRANDKSKTSNPTDDALKIFKQAKELLKEKNTIDVTDMEFDDEVEFTEEGEMIHGDDSKDAGSGIQIDRTDTEK